jgi:hypothetical protein
MVAWMAGLAFAGDVWFAVDAREGDGTAVRLEIPAAWVDGTLPGADGRPVDPAAIGREVAAGPVGSSRAVDLRSDDGTVAHATFTHRAPAPTPATSIALDLGGAGAGLSLSLPLTGAAEALRRAGSSEVRLKDGADLAAALVGYPGTVLFQATARDGGSVRVMTR